jgi:hypothetical protein
MAFARGFVFGFLCFARIEHHLALDRIHQCKTAIESALGADADDHRDAALPRQYRDMAGRAAMLQGKASARPVMRKECAGRYVLAEIDRAGRYVGARGSRQRGQHPVADVGKVGGAGAEIFVV